MGQVGGWVVHLRMIYRKYAIQSCFCVVEVEKEKGYSSFDVGDFFLNGDWLGD